MVALAPLLSLLPLLATGVLASPVPEPDPFAIARPQSPAAKPPTDAVKSAIQGFALPLHLPPGTGKRERQKRDGKRGNPLDLLAAQAAVAHRYGADNAHELRDLVHAHAKRQSNGAVSLQ